MQREDENSVAGASPSAFAIYLRTGRRTWSGRAGRSMEYKFNPYHDPKDGKFTFATGGGIATGWAGHQSNSRGRSAEDGFGGGGSSDGGDATGNSPDPRRQQPNNNDPRDPRNYTVHTVKAGDSLAKIAALRKGVTPADLAWLNGTPIDVPLWVGQQIKLPNQESRDRARDAKNMVLALDYYMQTHGGRLPPNGAHPPSLLQQTIRQSGWRETKANGYTFATDKGDRTQLVDGDLTLDTLERRSRANQARAGGSDRLVGDDGGHYVAVRFNGPRGSFNHFAQDANFNRGAYRALEGGWARDLRLGRRVHVDILSHYIGASKRPDSLDVTWFVDGKEHHEAFPNYKKGQ